jgi:trans-aconitate methyltransferase
MDDPALDELLAEQIAYYRARAPEYTATAMPQISQAEHGSAEREILAAIRDFAPRGHVLELACGPGSFTAELARHADTLTAVDASPEMISLASAMPGTERVRFIRADLFSWSPEDSYDVVFFGFWLSHVPLERFESFWSMVRRSLRPGGRVFFVDDAFRTPDELVEGEGSTTIQRRLNDGTSYRAVKVPHTPSELVARLAELGWRFEIRRTAGPFFWGTGSLEPGG